ncbi:4-hydroxy-3-methylbut-2-enyl diphosphate reductase [Rhodohalobacter barkolensis]|uniref:4-hydroxy-3-methylbut-2-enyl diphosphate reductase n=1 Tax=Rhodohalobacter barkolensis TaxID=2053187 RepID=A0A2N0VEB6_9BACT|nr:4-hydroxy-3-methylbut-2-enyl diphosphate reductase [Rhodohalobacter barkolensis]PKD42536.1 4-hydroxy-3-methylbut-2-enyl diphosphate reductase [Rhodohalobacter barkolensis]
MARKEFEIPAIFKSPIIRKVKEANKITDPRKKDLAPTELNFGPVTFLIPRHFGFCYGVENAIDIAYRTVEENPDKNIYLLSEMIHNPTVNEDLQKRGVKFLFDTDGSVRIPIEDLSEDDVVIVPAFGTTIEIGEKLKAKGIDPYQYNTTCPFVEKVWKRGNQLGKKGYSLVVHGKHLHEETRATFSHSADHSPTVVVLNPEEAQILADIMTEKRPIEDFEKYFGHKSTDGFNPLKDLEFFGVINQTTMLATETQQVMEILKKASKERFGEENVANHFADTSDTLCYATNENQSATYALADAKPDIAIVVGGYNSSNTMHLVEILEHHCPTYHIRDAEEFDSSEKTHHFNQWEKEMKETTNWLPKDQDNLKIALTSGASCPDVLVDEVMLKVLSLFDDTKDVEEVIRPFEEKLITEG